MIFIIPVDANNFGSYYSTNNISNGTRPYQISLNISNAVGVNNATHIFTNGHANSNFSDIRFILDNTTLLPYWIENITTGKVWVNVTANGTVNMYYGNISATSLSNGDNTFLQYHGLSSSAYLNPLTIPPNISFIYETLISPTNSVHNLRFGLSNFADWSDEALTLGSYTVDPTKRFSSLHDGSSTSLTSVGSLVLNQYYRGKIIYNGTSAKGYFDDVQIGNTDINTTLPTSNMGLFLQFASGTATQNWSFVRINTATTQVWEVWGNETGKYIPPTPTNLTYIKGNDWINYSWNPGIGNITDYYNIFYNITWYNNTIVNYFNSSFFLHWNNISIYAVNNSDQNNTPLINTTLFNNNSILLTNVNSSYYVNEGELLYIDANYTDLDGDIGIFDDNSTFWNIDHQSGIINWVPSYSSAGIYNFQINVSDGFGSIDIFNFSVTVNDSSFTLIDSNTKYIDVVLNNSMITGTISNYQVFINLSIPSINNITTDGTNIRTTFFSDSNISYQTPREVLYNSTTGRLILYTRINLISNTTYNNTVRIQFGNMNLTEPALNSVYGKYNTWYNSSSSGLGKWTVVNHFWDTSTNFSDSTGNGHYLTGGNLEANDINNSGMNSGDISVNLSASGSDYILGLNSVWFNFDSSNFTIFNVAKRTGSGVCRVDQKMTSDALNGYYFQIGTTSIIYTSANNSEYQNLEYIYNTTQNQYYTMSVSKSGTVGRLFNNGINVSSGVLNKSINTNTNFNIGYFLYDVNNYFYDCNVDENWQMKGNSVPEGWETTIYNNINNANIDGFYSSITYNNLEGLQYSNISGYVKSITNLPLINAYVKIGTLSTYTNEFGYYFIPNIYHGDISVVVQNIHYITNNTTILNFNNDTTNYNISLTPIVNRVIGTYIQSQYMKSDESMLISNVNITSGNISLSDLQPSYTKRETFIDSIDIETNNGLTLGINRPTRYTNNPIFGNNSWSWDRDIGFVSVSNVSGVYNLLYGAIPDNDTASGQRYTAFANSTDPLNFTKPSLGMYAYNGSTDNNIIAPRGTYIGNSIYNPEDISERRVIVLGGNEWSGTSVVGNVEIYTAPGYGQNFSSALTLNYDSLTHLGIGDVIKKPDGKYIIGYQWFGNNGLGTNTRQIGIYSSDTTNISGTYTDHISAINNGTVATAEKYSMNMFYYGDVILGVIPIYNSATGYITKLELWSSRDGIVWTLEDGDWFLKSDCPAWDCVTMYSGGYPVDMKNLNTTYFYYIASNITHDSGLPYYQYMGVYNTSYGRIGQISGTGNFTTTSLNTTYSNLTINVNASEGDLKAELLYDNNNSVIPGYSQNDFDTITTNEFYKIGSWGGNFNFPNTPVKIKFYMNNSILYSYEAYKLITINTNITILDQNISNSVSGIGEIIVPINKTNASISLVTINYTGNIVYDYSNVSLIAEFEDPIIIDSESYNENTKTYYNNFTYTPTPNNSNVQFIINISNSSFRNAIGNFNILINSTDTNIINYSFSETDWLININSSTVTSFEYYNVTIEEMSSNITTPLLSSITNQTCGSNYCNITFDLNQTDAITQVKYGLNTSLLQNLSNQSSGSSRINNITGLANNTKYYYSVWAWNNSNNSYFVNSTIQNFTTLEDYVPPVINGSPLITEYTPTSPNSTQEGTTATFTISTNQTVNILWTINGISKQANNSVSSAIYSNSTGGVGTYNVTASVSNANGSTSQIWSWEVTEIPPPTYSLSGVVIPSGSTIAVTGHGFLTGGSYDFGEVFGGSDVVWVNVSKTGYISNNSQISFSSANIVYDVTLNLVPSSGDFIPPTPVSCSAIQGVFQITTTCSAGIGNITDSMNKTDEITWINSSDFFVINSGMTPHSWSNITMYAYNNTGNGSLNNTPEILNTKLNNNIPILSTIGNKFVVVNNTLTFTLSATDADNDILIYDTDATKGTTFNNITGEYTWTTTPSDIGSYTWSFNVTDNQTPPGIDTEIINVIVSEEAPPITLKSAFIVAQNSLYSFFSSTTNIFCVALMVLAFGIILYGFKKQNTSLILLGITTIIIAFAMLLLGNYIISAIVSALPY